MNSQSTEKVTSIILKWLLKGNALSTGSLRKIMEISPEDLNGYWDFKGTI